MMFISVVVPTYGRPDNLKNCLASLAAQVYPKGDCEVIVVEDGSTTNVKSLVESYGFRYLWQPHRGPAAARNLGVRNAGGELIAFTDDDCVVPAKWLAALADGYRRYSQAVGVGGYMEAPAGVLCHNPYAQYESYMTHQVYGAGQQEVLGGFEVPTGGTNNISYHRDIFEKFGGFDENFPVAAGEDADFKKRVCSAGGRLLYLPLKVTHHHRYSWYSFLRQNLDRGLGSLYFHKKHGSGMSRWQLFGGIIVFPLNFIKAVLTERMPLRMVLLREAALCINYATQLGFYGKI